MEVPKRKKIILFGSAARGEMNEHSDLDLLFIKNGVDWSATGRRIRGARPPKSPPLGIVIASTAEIELNRRDRSCFIRDALEEGRVPLR